MSYESHYHTHTHTILRFPVCVNQFVVIKYSHKASLLCTSSTLCKVEPSLIPRPTLSEEETVWCTKSNFLG